MVSDRLRRSLIWSGGFLFCILVICGLLVYSKSQTGRGSETTGYPVYISDLFVSGNEVFMLRTRDESSIPREYDVYRVNKDGQEQYVQPYPGKAAHWNRDTGKLYFLSEMEICEFDPVTGQCRSYAVERSYEKICAVEEEYIFLQQEIYGPVYMYLATTGKESMLGASGWVLDAYDGYLLTWAVCIDKQPQTLAIIGFVCIKPVVLHHIYTKDCAKSDSKRSRHLVTGVGFLCVEVF